MEVDPKSGGKCKECARVVPATVTRMSLTMSFSDVTRGFGYAEKKDDSPDELIGCTLGHFEIIEPIGQGGMGQVYRALDTSLQRYVAVKVIRGGGGGDIDSRGQQRLMHEAVAQARVNHPNIVTIYYVGREGETPFLAMELIDGYDASELIKQGEIPYESLCSIAMKITHALDVASQTGIIHADIKPQNLLILNDGNVKLSDFGMARIDEDDKDKLLGGTPNYLAPELLQGEKSSIQSDMYALGVTLFELTFGRLPVALTGSTLEEWSKIHAESSIKFPEPWPDHLPEKWKSVLLRLLDTNPENRYESYEELGTELRSILPVRRRNALLLARTIAWWMDLFTIVLAAALPLGLLAGILNLQINIGNLALLPILGVYLLVVYWWRQSPGRELVHVKIVNQYSLVPTRKTMVLREMIRFQFFWFVLAGALVGMAEPIGEVILVGLGVIGTMANYVYTATIGRGQSLHDKLLKTRAVVGSDTN